MIRRLIFLFLCVGVSVEEIQLEQHFVNVNLAKEYGGTSQDRRRVIIPEGQPTVKVTIGDVKGQLGSDVMLECFIDVNPRATNFWMKGAERIREDDPKYRIIEASIHNFMFRYRLRLQIINLDKTDYLHTFRCFSHNKFGDHFGAIHIQSVPPKVIATNNTVEGQFRSEVTLECNIEAYPPAVVYWLNSKGEQILDGGRFSLYNEEPIALRYKTQLKIKNLEIPDFASYKCVASNTLGEHHQIVKLKKAKPTPKPKIGSLSSGDSILKRTTSAQFCFILLCSHLMLK